MLYWHAERTFKLEILTGPGQWLRITKLTLRGYDQPDGYAQHLQFLAVLQAEVFQALEVRAFLHGMLRMEGGQLRRQDYRGIARLLRDDYKVTTGCADRHGDEVIFSAARWAA